MEAIKNNVLLAIAILSSIITFLTPFYLKWKARTQAKADRLFIGIVRCKTPECLSGYRDFTDYNKALESGYKVVILHCRNLSYALRKCDFVIADAAEDEKIINPEDVAAIKQILP